MGKPTYKIDKSRHRTLDCPYCGGGKIRPVSYLIDLRDFNLGKDGGKEMLFMTTRGKKYATVELEAPDNWVAATISFECLDCGRGNPTDGYSDDITVRIQHSTETGISQLALMRKED